MLSEPTLVKRARAGEASAQRSLFQLHRDHLYRVAFRMMGNREDAEEVTLDAFGQAIRRLEQFDGRSSFSTWCYRILINRSLDRLRKLDRRARHVGAWDPEAYLRVPDATASTERAVLRVELQQYLESGLATLSHPIRMAVVLRDIEGLSYAEISDAMECSLGTVASRLARGRAQLAEYLEGVGIDATYFSTD